MPSTILITGANRGIGLGLTKVFLMRPSTTVVAAVRDPSSAKSLSSLPTAADSRLIVVKVDSTSSTDALSAVDSLKSQGISHLDVVIANSGIASHYGPAASTPLEEARAHFEVNALGPLALFQATMPLLQKSDVTPKFVAVSTILSSLGDMEQMPMPTTAYGSSKAALNYIVRKIHFENEWLIVFPIHPGYACFFIQSWCSWAYTLSAGGFKQIWATLARGPWAWKLRLLRLRIVLTDCLTRSTMQLVRRLQAPCNLSMGMLLTGEMRSRWRLRYLTFDRFVDINDE